MVFLDEVSVGTIISMFLKSSYVVLLGDCHPKNSDTIDGNVSPPKMIVQFEWQMPSNIHRNYDLEQWCRDDNFPHSEEEE